MKYTLTITLCLAVSIAFSQTPGQIYEQATPATNPMDPNGDGYVSVGGTGYTAGQEDDELAWISIPQYELEPDADPASGGSCGATDVVDDPSSGADASYVLFDATNDVLIYRIRLAEDAAGAFGFSVLVDTDEKFGFIGTNPDPNAVADNPGFEFEIRFKTGGGDPGVYVEDIDGSTTTNSLVNSYTLGTNSQRSYARFQDADCTGDAVFYDFFVPLDDLGVTASSVVRLAAATSSSPGNSVLKNLADIAGTDDASFADADDAWIALIDLQNGGTPIGNLDEDGCFLSGTSDTPTVSPIIFDSNSRINGTSTEPEGAFITVFSNGDTLGTTTTVDANGRWSVAFTQGDLRPFDAITVIARDSCEYESAASTASNVVNDLDSDNDGILDSDEGNGADPGGDDDGDDIPNYLDTDYPGFVDTNPADGINDNFDADGDGIPNHFDTDSDGDGIDDVATAGGGALDGDNDGTIDTMEDADGDGIPNSADVDFTAGTDANNDGIDDSVQGGTDTDGDGIQDTDDPDIDGDGLVNELDPDNGGTALSVVDTDGDGILDFLDLDSDGDGIADSVEGTADFDGDGIPNHQDIDADNDGILDNIEAQTASAYIAPTGTDTDGDGLDDAYDTDNGGTTIVPVNSDSAGNPDYLDVDSDGDGVGDFTEANDANSNGISDVVDVLITGGTDADADGIDDAFDASETACTDTYNANDGSATADGICDNVQDGSATDTDGDGLADIYDTDNGGTSVANPDTDGDGTPNYQDTDDDGDGILTSVEGTGFTQGGAPIPDYLYDPDTDGDGINNDTDIDSDNDGILDAHEDGGTGFDPSGDADGDGVLNYLDSNDVTGGFPAFTDANNDGVNDAYDTDHDGIPDFLDLDSDGDGIVDILEAGGTDADGNGLVDGFTDGNSDGMDDTIGVSGLTTSDTDGDGLDDNVDIDADNDGIVDNVEGQASSAYIAPTGSDADRDGIDDAYDTDSGGTAISPVNTDSTGNPDYQDTDSDDDGVNDIIEGHDNNLNGVGDWDNNGDGTVNGAEGTGDADGDGLLDAFDTVTAPDAANNPTGSNANLQDTDGNGTMDFQDDDDDGDGIDTATEGTGFSQGGGTIPDYLFNPDADGDGVNDIADVDSDNDGIPDIDENGGVVDILGAGSGEQLSPTDDRDGDGILNYLDLSDVNFTATDSNGDGIVDEFDTDLDGIADFRDLDADNDGVFDIVEAGGTDADNNGILDDVTDTDLDGYPDLVDVDNGGTALTNNDSDGDGVSDVYDVDSDNDGLPDIIEYGGFDADGNGRVDNSTDSDRDGIADLFDTDSGNSPLTPFDTDGDGLVDNASDRDSDGDGISDLVEAGGTDADNDGRLDSLTDTDGDGLPDVVDSDNGGTPLSVPDTDGDGIRDYLDLDSDADGITDNVEAQTDGGYVAPNNASDANGFDTAYGGVSLDPEDTDLDGTADYIDTDSDDDSISDQIEGNDANADGAAETTPSGSDSDNDGIDDTFDADNGGTPLSPQDLDTDGANDYRDADDDGDAINSIDEPLDINPANGTPNYLENSVGSCGVGFITTSFNGSVDAIFSNSGVINFSEVLGGSDDTGAEFDDLNDFFIIDLTDEIPQGNSLTVRFRSTTNNRDINLRITSSLTSGGTYADTQDFFTSSTTFSNAAYTVNTSGGIRYLRVELTTQEHPSGDGELDAITYNFTQCDADNDLDGIADVDDNDDDNDGIPDTVEGLTADATGDDDGDGTLNYLDTDYSHPTEGAFVDTNGDGVNDHFDFDLDGIPNNFDLDSDNDGIPDAVEANDGVLPANMIDEGRFTVAYVQVNDFDSDGHANIYDTSTGGSALPTNDTDTDGAADYLDTDADNDGYGDVIESNDDDLSGDALNDLLTKAANFETAAGDPGYYLTTDGDLDGIPNWLEDDDGDGIFNFLDPFGAGSAFYQDTDGDGLVDLFDSSTNGTASTINDNDSNGVPDYLQSGALVTLPVEYVYFRAKEENGNVHLTWATAVEINNDRFEIEHSINGEAFSTIGTVAGQGDTNEVQEYIYTHSSPSYGANYYRLRQVDYDGTDSYSDMKLITVSILGNISITVYPNPSSDIIHVNADAAISSIKITALDGRTAFSRSYQQVVISDTINIAEISSGIYIVRVEGPGYTSTQKLIVR